MVFFQVLFSEAKRFDCREPAIVQWASEQAADSPLLARAAPFLEWLKTADEDDDDEEEEEE